MQKPSYHYRGRFISLLERDNWEYAELENSQGLVAIIATTETQDIVLVEQFRIPVNSRVIELPAGLVADSAEFQGESVITAGRRELFEETGFEARNWSEIMTVPLSAGLTSAMLGMVRATGLHRSGEGGGDSSEDILTHIIPLTELGPWLEQQRELGKQIDHKVYAALYWIANPLL